MGHMRYTFIQGDNMSTFIKSALIRALRTVCQTAGAMVGTAVGLSDLNWWMLVAASVLAGIRSSLTSVATGLPEADYEMALYMNHDEPEDSEIEDEN